MGAGNIFVSYASEQRALAEAIALSLRSRGFTVHLDRDLLRPAGSYDPELYKAIQDSDLLVFLISPQSVKPGRYTLSELKFAREKWPDPRGRVLPVLVEGTDFAAIPQYLKSVNVLEPQGNVAAEVGAAVSHLLSPPRAVETGASTPKRKVGLAALGLGVIVLVGAIFLINQLPDDAMPGFLTRKAAVTPLDVDATVQKGVFVPKDDDPVIKARTLEIRADAGGGGTRFELGLPKGVTFRFASLMNPNRIVIDVDDERDVMLPKLISQPVGHVVSFRSGLAAPGKQRIVIDATRPVQVQVEGVELGTSAEGRQWIALKIVDQQIAKAPDFSTARSGLGAKDTSPATEAVHRLAALSPSTPDKTALPVIVIDAAHGGYDSGSVHQGKTEKDAALAFAIAVRDRLIKDGVARVEMTRDADVFVSLEERVDQIRRLQPGLAMSVHGKSGGEDLDLEPVRGPRERIARPSERGAGGEVVASMPEARTTSGVGRVAELLQDLATREAQSARGRRIVSAAPDKVESPSDPDVESARRFGATLGVPAIVARVRIGGPPVDNAAIAAEAADRIALLLGVPRKSKPGTCRVFTASYGGMKAALVMHMQDGRAHYTVLDVNEGQEQREVEAYIAAYASGGHVVSTFASQSAALDKAFELCPEG